jgi:hypothetical protein
MSAVGSRQFGEIGGPVERHLPYYFEYEWLQCLVTWSNKDMRRLHRTGIRTQMQMQEITWMKDDSSGVDNLTWGDCEN